MGWIKQTPPEHFCKPPHPEISKLGDLEYGEGSLWACDDCGQVFEFDGLYFYKVIDKEETKKRWWKR